MAAVLTVTVNGIELADGGTIDVGTWAGDSRYVVISNTGTAASTITVDEPTYGGGITSNQAMDPPPAVLTVGGTDSYTQPLQNDASGTGTMSFTHDLAGSPWNCTITWDTAAQSFKDSRASELQAMQIRPSKAV